GFPHGCQVQKPQRADGHHLGLESSDMLSRTEVERLAAMANALRPDWPIPSLATHIGAHYVGRAYRDVACALAYVATDAQTQTPARLKEQGPWWRVTEESRQPPVGRRIPCPDHPE